MVSACSADLLCATTSNLHSLAGSADALTFFGTILSTFATLMGLIGIFAVYAHQRASDERRQDTDRTLRRFRNYLIGLRVPEEEVDKLVPQDLTTTETLALIKSNTGRIFDVLKSHLKKLPREQVQDHVTETEPILESFMTSLERIGYSDLTIRNASRLAGWSLGLNGLVALVGLLGMKLAPFLSSKDWLVTAEWATTVVGTGILAWDVIVGARIVASMGTGVVKSALKPQPPASGNAKGR